MKKFIVEDSFFNLFPEARIGVIIAKNIDNKVNTDYLPELKKVTGAVYSALNGTDLKDLPVIKNWRAAFKKFNAPRDKRSSVEALLRRAANGKDLPCINPLVDIYNIVSLKNYVPCGAEDIDKIDGDIKLTLAEGTEEFLILGREENTPPDKGEVIYKDDNGVICGCWNWRESERTMITEETKNAFVCVESISLDDNFEGSLKELKEMIERDLKGTCEMHILSITGVKEIIL